MKMKNITQIKTKGEGQQIAIDWQSWQSKKSMSYKDVITWQQYFIAIGKKFRLTNEFKENGII